MARGRKPLVLKPIKDFSKKSLKTAHHNSIGRALKFKKDLTDQERSNLVEEMRNRLKYLINKNISFFHGDLAKSQDTFDYAFFFLAINQIEKWQDQGKNINFKGWCSTIIMNHYYGEVRKTSKYSKRRYYTSLSENKNWDGDSMLDKTHMEILNKTQEIPKNFDEVDEVEIKLDALEKVFKQFEGLGKDILVLQNYKNMKKRDILKTLKISSAEYVSALKKTKKAMKKAILNEMQNYNNENEISFG